jgi:pimeloyl-ACP methyl ester carboxylesterase
MPVEQSYASRFYMSSDGLVLHARDYGRAMPGVLPVVCLPGLARTAADFHELASTLAGDPLRPRHVIAIDYRGRGLSERDPDPTHYQLAIESTDIERVLELSAIDRAAFVGTSRGGLHIMALAKARPDLVAAAVLNDIGPVIELAGLIRIKGYVGKFGTLATMAAAAERLAEINGASFPAFTSEDWRRYAERTFEETSQGVTARYDPALALVLADLSEEAPPAPLWPLFDELAGVPILAIRGACSDLFSPQTLAEMRERRPDMETLEVPGQGHAPPLWEDGVIARIAEFIGRIG